MTKGRAAVCLIMNDKEEILLLKRGASDTYRPGEWCLPGGKVEKGESVVEGCMREVQEETGLIPNVWERYIDNTRDRFSVHFFESFENIGNLKNYPDSEHDEAKWVTIEELKNYTIIELNKSFLEYRFNIKI